MRTHIKQLSHTTPIILSQLVAQLPQPLQPLTLKPSCFTASLEVQLPETGCTLCHCHA